jgi:pimeloyl-ACP methyl ester carboxylesterase
MKKFSAILIITMIALSLAIYAASPGALSVDDIQKMGLVEDDPRFIEISWRLALKYPHRVRALILVDAAGYPHESPAIFKLLRVPLLGEMLAGINAKSIVRKNLREVFYDDDLVTDAVVDNYYYRLLKKGNRETVLARARMTRDTLYKTLPQIQQPALIIWGEHDSWSPVEFGHRFAADIPNARLAVLPNCGHVPQEEKPEEVARLVRAFWREIRTR